MTLILPQIKFEAILSKDVGGVAFQAEADVLHQILGICHNSFSLVSHMALILRISDYLSNKCILLPSLIYASQVGAKCTIMCCDTPILPPAPLKAHFTSQAS